MPPNYSKKAEKPFSATLIFGVEIQFKIRRSQSVDMVAITKVNIPVQSVGARTCLREYSVLMMTK